MTTTTRQASCCCGQFKITCEGGPVRISVCHCFACQRRTGSAFGVQARFRRDQITAVEGRSTEYVRLGDGGKWARFHFCPVCGSTLHWENEGMTDLVAIAVGAFADHDFPAPTVSVYETRRHPWTGNIPTGADVQHGD